MTFVPAFSLSTAGMNVQRVKMDVTSSNLANAQTTRGPDGEPYKRIIPIFEAVPLEFDNTLNNEMGVPLSQVKMTGFKRDDAPFRRVYDPGHPDADDTGFVSLPNVNLIQEMSDMLLASRAYEANATAFNTTKGMVMKLFDIARG